MAKTAAAPKETEQEQGSSNKKPSMLARMKASQAAAKAGQRFEGIFFIKADQKKRIRFLSNIEPSDGVKGAYEFQMHSKWGDEDGLWPTPCQTYEGKECEYCAIMEKEGTGRDKIKLIPHYAFTVRDLNEKKNYIFCYPAGGRSPLPLMMELYEKYGTLLDRAYEIKISGERQNKTWVLIPEDKQEWRHPAGSKGFEPFTKREIYDALKKSGGWKDGRDSNGGGEKAASKGDDDE